MSTNVDGAPDFKVSQPGPRAGQVHRRSHHALELAERFGLPLLLVAVVVFFCLMRSQTFATGANFRNILSSQSVLAVVALALMLPLLGGRFDVSVGSNLGLCAIFAAALMSSHHWALVPAIIATLALGAFVGLVNGLIVAYLGVNSIIATIGTGSVMDGLVQAYTNGAPITSGLSPGLSGLSSKNVVGVPTMFLIMVGIAIVVWALITQTPYGRTLTATGSNSEAARLVGMRVQRIVLISFIGAGVLGGVAGVLEIAAQGSADPSAAGLAFILPSLAAVFLGATTLRPGTYNVAGTILGLYFVGTVISGLVLLGVAPWVTDVVDGASVVVAIAISAQFRRRRTGSLDMGT